MSGFPFAKPEEIGFDAARLQVAYDLLAQWTEGPDAAIPGGALLVGRNGRAIEPQFFGRHGPEPDAGPIRRDGAFLLASISKPVTYLAAMLLVERGQLGLADPVTRYIPDFAAHHKAGGSTVRRRATRSATSYRPAPSVIGARRARSAGSTRSIERSASSLPPAN